MPLISGSVPDWLRRPSILIWVLVIVLLYAYFISNVSTNPPGFYVDESCLAYNGYLIATTGAGENGTSFPLYFQCYTQGYSQWANPVHVYLLAGLYLIVPPSTLSARIFAATMVFFAALILGLLARRLSGRNLIGVIVALTALFTPWLFEISRMVLETFFYPLAVALFLLCVHNAFRRKRWSNLDCLLIAFTLSLLTYSYTIGRFLGPVFGLGLLIFATSWRQLFRVVKTGIVYSLLMIPFLIVYFGSSAAIMERFGRATYLDGNKPLIENLSTFITSYGSDLSPIFFILAGDSHPRHHIVGMGEFLVGTFALALLGLLLIVCRHRSNAWWRYIVFGLFVSIVPGALTTERHHSLRLIAFPIFFLLATVPALCWLLERRSDRPLNENELASGDARPNGFLGTLWSEIFLRRTFLIGLLVLTVIQAIMFQISYAELGPLRSTEFNGAYPRVLKKALDEGSIPIYLDEGAEPAYIHAYWYGASWGIDRSSFVHLLDNQYPPYNALVLSSDSVCTECDVILRDGTFLLYRNKKQGSPALLPVQQTTGLFGKAPGQFIRPRGIAVDQSGNRYITDTDNSRVQKLDPEGKFVALIGTSGTAEGQMMQPHGIVVDPARNIYVSEAYRHTLMRFKPDGTFDKEWHGPELGYFGPRDLAIDAEGRIYVVDQGRSRIVRFDPRTEEYFEWGNNGNGDGQFDQPTGIAVSAGLVFVADIGNDRVEMFDTSGNYLRQWQVPEWQRNVPTFPDVAYDERAKRVYVSSGSSTEVRVYELDGNYVESVRPYQPDVLNNPSSLAITQGPYGTRVIVLNTGSDIASTGAPSIVTIDGSGGKSGPDTAGKKGKKKS